MYHWNRTDFPYNFSSQQLGSKGTQSKEIEKAGRKGTRHGSWMAGALKAEAVIGNTQGPAPVLGQSSISIQTG